MTLPHLSNATYVRSCATEHTKHSFGDTDTLVDRHRCVAFTKTYSTSAGCIVRVLIHTTLHDRIRGRWVRALIDSGAASSCVMGSILDAVSAPFKAVCVASTINGEKMRCVHSVRVGDHTGVVDLDVISVDSEVGHGVGAILGRDYLKHRTFTLDGRARTFDVHHISSAGNR